MNDAHTNAQVDDAHLDSLVAQLAPVDDDTVIGWDLDGADLALLTAITADQGAVVDPAPAPGPRRPGPRRPRRRLMLAAAAGLALAIPGLVLLGPIGRGGQPAYAAELVRAAERGPRLLLDDPAWKVTDVYESDRNQMEMRFTDGRHRAQLNTYRADLYDSYVKDREGVPGATAQRTTFRGRPAVTISYDGSPGETLARLDGPVFVDFTVRGTDARTYAAVLSKLRPVGVTAWLDALPASVYSADRRSSAIEGMLRGIPLPPGYSSTALKEQGLVSDRYQLGARVVADVGCIWFDRWFTARERGDAAAQAAAGRVLQGSHQWPILLQMQDEGAYPQIFWIYADATRDGTVEDETTPMTRDRVVNPLGCPRT